MVIFRWTYWHDPLRILAHSVTSRLKSGLSNDLRSAVASGRPVSTQVWVHHLFGGRPRSLGLESRDATHGPRCSIQVLRPNARTTWAYWFSQCMLLLCPYARSFSWPRFWFSPIIRRYGLCLSGVRCEFNDYRYNLSHFQVIRHQIISCVYT